MSPRIDKVLRRVLIVVAIADVILFLNTSRPESLTSFSFDPIDSIVRYWYLFVSLAILAVVGVRALRRSRRDTTPSGTSAPKAP
ncbi:MAG TPA: hypothetical protein VFV98_00055 [Vicinamibacterales bacterium]|nr:hypothetical protein [Vicinamibacterales bacterium]